MTDEIKTSNIFDEDQASELFEKLFEATVRHELRLYECRMRLQHLYDKLGLNWCDTSYRANTEVQQCLNSGMFEEVMIVKKD